MKIQYFSFLYLAFYITCLIILAEISNTTLSRGDEQSILVILLVPEKGKEEGKKARTVKNHIVLKIIIIITSHLK